MNQAKSLLVHRHCKELYKVEGYWQKAGEVRKLFTKGEEGSLQTRASYFGGKRTQGSLDADYLPNIDQVISDGLFEGHIFGRG